MCENEQNPEPH